MGWVSMGCVLSLILCMDPHAEVQPGGEFNEAIQCGGQRVGNQLVLNVISKSMKEVITECSSVLFALMGLGPEVNGEISN